MQYERIRHSKTRFLSSQRQERGSETNAFLVCGLSCLRVCFFLFSCPFFLSKATRTTADLKAWQAWLQGKLGMFATKDYLETALKDTNERLKGLSQRHYDPKRVYITFQTEQAQRRCLKAVETGESYTDRPCIRCVHFMYEVAVCHIFRHHTRWADPRLSRGPRHYPHNDKGVSPRKGGELKVP